MKPIILYIKIVLKISHYERLGDTQKECSDD